MICVLDVTQGPARGKRFWIREDESVQIGRISTADFSVPNDKHMSRHHLILEGSDAKFRIRDVGSANGTYVNDAKVAAIELCNGDLIKAGETVFEVSVLNDTENPHAKDVTFNSSVSGRSDVAIAQAASVAEPSGSVAADGSGLGELAHKPNDSREIAAAISEPISDEDSTRRVADDFDLGDPRLKTPSTNQPTRKPWWNQFTFAEVERPFLFRQSSNADECPVLSEIIPQLEQIYPITAIIHAKHLRRFDRQLIDTLARKELVEWHREGEVCSVSNDCTRDFHLLLDSLVTQDALVLLGAQAGVSQVLIELIAQDAYRPSLVTEQLADTTGAVRKGLLAGVDFVLFENDDSGRLNLFVRT